MDGLNNLWLSWATAIPEELNAVAAEWETSDINDQGYEQLSDEDVIQHVRGSESPKEEEGED